MSTPLLAPGKSIRLPATTGQFRVKDHFFLNADSGRVNIGYIVGGFLPWFSERVEGPVQETTLQYHELQDNAPDSAILADLRPQANIETTLTHIFSLMQRERLLNEGILAINGWENLFYVRDASAVLRAVAVHWCEEGWFVAGSPVGRSQFEWPVRDRVFSRTFRSE